MKVTIEGIVLNETNYKETSKILNILTKDYGLISVIAKGARTLKSKIRGVSMKLVYANYTISYKENSLSTLIEGMPIDSLKYIMTDFSKMNYAVYIVELVRNVLKENNHKDLFLELRDALIKINEGFDPAIITNIMEVKLLKYLGVDPVFSECINCHSEAIFTFDISRGGALCKNCYQNTYLFLKQTLKLLRLFQVVEIKKIDKLQITNPKVREELNLFLREYYETYTGIYLRNKEKLGKLNLIK